MFRSLRILSSRVPSTLGRRAFNSSLPALSSWDGVSMGPKDPILGVTEAYKAETSPKKLNLGVGAYRDDTGKPVVLKSIAAASAALEEEVQASKLDNEYLPIHGLAALRESAVKLAYGQDVPEHVAIQSLSGTGALRLIGAFLNRFYEPSKTIYLPNPTWGNHFPVFQDAGLTTETYSYYKPETMGLDLEGLLADVNKAPNGSIFLFHACAHNPTGVDPTEEQWKEISAACKAKDHFLVVDSAYQGFASGSPEKDAFAISQFVKDGHKIALCQSFAKNFGLYGQRIGVLSVLTEGADETARVDSQLKIIARAMYSNPPLHGARLVAKVFEDKDLYAQWQQDVKEMADRIITMRTMLYDELKACGSTRNWQHIKDQIGMFCYSGLTGEQVDKLASDHFIFMTRNGRISMAGVTSENVKYLAQSIHAVTSE